MADPNARHTERNGQSETPSIGARIRSPKTGRGRRKNCGSTAGTRETASRGMAARRIPRGLRGWATIADMAWDVIGHGWAVSLLQQHLESGQVRHAYLFSGPPAIGKRTLALRFAQAMLCQQPPRAGEFCGECRACRLVRGESHPDLHLLTRLESKSEIGIDQVRELQRQLSLTPVEGRRRVGLLADFHEASDGASNALLKTLEEPAGGAVLLLTAPAAESVLPAHPPPR